MRVIILALVISILCMPIGVYSFEGPPGIGEKFPMFSGYTVDGHLFDLQNFLNREMFIYVDFWATWCGPCKTQMPFIMNAWLEYGNEDLMVVGINLDEEKNLDQVYEYMAETQISFPVINDYTGISAPLSVELMVDYIPQGYLLAPDGTVLFRDLENGELKTAVAMLIEMNANPSGVETEITIVDDPRSREGFLTPDIVDEGHTTNPNPDWLYDRPDELVIQIEATSKDMQLVPATLIISVCRPTGRSTHLLSDSRTGDVYRSETGRPYVFWEVEHEFIEVDLTSEDGKVDTSIVLPLTDDTFEVTIEVEVYSAFYQDFVVSPMERINFPCLYFVTPEEIESQGGIWRLH